MPDSHTQRPDCKIEFNNIKEDIKEIFNKMVSKTTVGWLLVIMLAVVGGSVIMMRTQNESLRKEIKEDTEIRFVATREKLKEVSDDVTEMRSEMAVTQSEQKHIRSDLQKVKEDIAAQAADSKRTADTMTDIRVQLGVIQAELRKITGNN